MSIYAPIDDRIMQPRRLGLANEIAEGISGTLVHSAAFGMVKTSIKLSADLTLVAAAGAAAKAGGEKLFDFPNVKIVPVAGRVVCRLELSAAAATSTAGELGLGSVIASGANATLTGATWQDIIAGGVPALGNITAGSTINAAVYDSFRGFIPSAAGFGGSLFVNAASTFAVATTDLNILSGSEIDVWWIALES